jgi:NADH-quinone oxidoreductase subunit G
VQLNPQTAAALALTQGQRVRVTQSGTAVLAVSFDERVAAGTVRIAAGHPDTAALGGQSGVISLEAV